MLDLILKKITSFIEFKKYYWYSEELKSICKDLGLNRRGTKRELYSVIESYFNGVKIKDNVKGNKKEKVKNYDFNSSLLQINFKFNVEFRLYFQKITKNTKFKFTANMAEAVRQVKKNNDLKFTLNDLLDVYLKRVNKYQYDNSMCEWNKFYADYCKDEYNHNRCNKLKEAAKFWKYIKDSRLPKKYDRKLYLDFLNN